MTAGLMSGSILEELDLPTSLVDAAGHTFGVGVADLVKSGASSGMSDLVVAFASEAAKEVAIALAGPLLRGLLRASDQTSKKLDAIIAEPFTTGAAAAKEALDMTPVSAGDRRMRAEQFQFASGKLQTACTHAKGRRSRPTRLYITILLALIAQARGAQGYASQYSKSALDILRPEQQELARLYQRQADLRTALADIPAEQFAQWVADYRRDAEWLGIESGYHGIGPVVPLERVELRLRNELMQITERIDTTAPTIAFLQALSAGRYGAVPDTSGPA